MKVFAFLASTFALASYSFAKPTNSLERFSPHFSTNTFIIWKAPTNHMPKSLWIYKKLPNPFTAPMISNAVVLASFRSKGYPLPSTNRITLWDHNREGDDPLAGWFCILPDWGMIEFKVRNHAVGLSEGIPNDEQIAERARKYVVQLGINVAQLSRGAIRDNGCEYDDKGGLATNGYVCGRVITFARKIDGLDFQDENEGFTIEFGSHGAIRSFILNWPNLEREQNGPTANPQQIIACIKASKALVVPDDKPNYFDRIRNLANAKTFTITKITPYYGEGVYGEMPTNIEPPKIVMPFAELEAVADFGTSNVTVRLVSPILSSDVTTTPIQQFSR